MSDNITAGLDIEALYTNVSHQMTIASFTRRFCLHPRFIFLLDLLRFVLYISVFEFDGRHFKQNCGISIGTKLALAFTTLVIADLEEQFLKVFLYKPLSWLGYIDDVLAVRLHSRDHFETFVSDLNTLASRIHFTHELSPVAAVF